MHKSIAISGRLQRLVWPPQVLVSLSYYHFATVLEEELCHCGSALLPVQLGYVILYTDWCVSSNYAKEKYKQQNHMKKLIFFLIQSLKCVFSQSEVPRYFVFSRPWHWWRFFNNLRRRLTTWLLIHHQPTRVCRPWQLLHSSPSGFKWICQNWYMDLSKLIQGFL